MTLRQAQRVLADLVAKCEAAHLVMPQVHRWMKIPHHERLGADIQLAKFRILLKGASEPSRHSKTHVRTER